MTVGKAATNEGKRSGWANRYARTLSLTDSAVVLWATIGALIVRFGVPETETIAASARPYVVLSIVIAIAWWLMLLLSGSRDATVLGHGTEEFKRVLQASLWLFGVVAIVSYSLRFDTARGYIGVALPFGLIVLLLSRAIVRKYLHLERRSGRSNHEVLIIGDAYSAEHLVRALNRHPLAGYKPIGVYLPSLQMENPNHLPNDVPIVGNATDVDAIISDVEALSPDAVALSGGLQLPPKTIRALGWALAEMNVRLIMVPALTDVAGPRIHMQPVAGLPLVHVSTPNLEKGQRVLKRSFDILGSAILICLLIPVLVAVAVAVRIDSSGPVLFKQTRIGTAGAAFKMFKFRSMVVDAERQLEQLRVRSQGNDVLFKLKSDPRVTRVGRFIRRYSLDELPQLFNVLFGAMSLVGPRPPLPSEVEKYDTHAHRRLLVRPGMTGLWQVSGRSLLSWDDTVRLDLYYVENWSLLGDAAILLRTLRAVVGKHGAY